MRLADYRPPDFLIDTAELEFDLDPERSIVRNRMTLRLVGAPASLRLDGNRLELVSLALNGVPCAAETYSVDENGLTIATVPDRFTLEIVTACAPRANKTAKGLFELGGKLATQCEPQGFRQITYFLDRPDVLTRFRVRLEADEKRFPVLLSNGNPVAAGRLEGGRHFAQWDDPFPKPCYIFAVMAGDFGVLRDRFTTASGREVQLAIHADHALVPRCAFAMEAVKRALAWDEKTFGLEYDLSHYNIVALTGWAGATENKGLNLFEAHGIVTDPETTTDDDYIIIERIVGHEQFHNWTGNRVTCRDWFQLSLKEGLTRLRDQLFIADRLGPESCRIDNVKVLRRNQFPEDDGPAAHSIQPVEGASVSSFYTGTVYEKGAEVVRMLIALLGWEGFRAGFDLYIARHDGHAVTTEDFIAAMEAASGHDLAQFRRWYRQGGRPRINASGQHDAQRKRYALTLRQTCRRLNGAPEPEPFHIPIVAGLLARDGQPLAETEVLELKEAEQTFLFENVAQPPVPSLLRGFSAPVTVEAGLGEAELALLLAHDSDAYVRWDAAQRLCVQAIRDLAASLDIPAALPATLMDAFGTVLRDRSLDALLKAEILTLPDEPVLSEGLREVDLDGLMAGRAALRRGLATAFKDLLLETYHGAASDAPYAPDMAQIAQRRLRNGCLDLLMALETPQVARLGMAQLTGATNMTDQFAALTSLSHLDLPEREAAFGWFYERWVHHKIAIDKWFNAQALSRAPGAAARIVALCRHPGLGDNDMARAVLFYGGFFRQNRVAFHDPSGAGYDCLAERLLEMDRLGRSNSHYLMPQINRWRRYDPDRRALMKAALDRVAGTAGISASLRANVLRALAPEE
jgi:aminopeptidase N